MGTLPEDIWKEKVNELNNLPLYSTMKNRN